MGDIIKGIEFLGIPATVAIMLVGVFLILQVIGELCELKGKIVPEFLKIRKYFKRKKEENKEITNTLKEVKQLLGDVNSHYNEDNITKRDEWMTWVNNRAVVYDDALNKLLLLQDKLNENNEITLELYINVNRNRILDFARIVADDNVLASREEFNRIYKINKEYHEILTKYNKTNGEVDTAMKLINEAYDYRLRHRSFIEDVRGYNQIDSTK
jgi:hypothetical protein